MSGHIAMERLSNPGYISYLVACEECDYKRVVVSRKRAGELMVDHSLYHDRPRPKRYGVEQ